MNSLIGKTEKFNSREMIDLKSLKINEYLIHGET